MNLHPLAAVAGGIVIGLAAWWWLDRSHAEASKPTPVSAAAADSAGEADVAGIWLYRWRDDAGNLQITDTPPRGRRYERIDREPRSGIEVDGRRP